MPKHGEVFRGNVKCEDCKNEFTWIYQYLQKDNPSAFVMPKKRANEEILGFNSGSKANCYCPKCGFKNYYDLVPY